MPNESTLSKMGFKKYRDTWNLSSNLVGEATPFASPVQHTQTSSSIAQPS